MTSVAVTGSSSAVGGAVATAATARGFHVVPFGRSAGQGGRRFDLRDSACADLDGIDRVIHLAWDFTADGHAGWMINHHRSLALAHQCRTLGIPMTLLSTYSAYARDRSAYGRMKYEIECPVVETGGGVVRAGLIWGGPGGIVATLRKIASLPMVCPHLLPEPMLYHSEIRRLAELVVDVATGTTDSRRVLGAAREPIGLHQILHAARQMPARFHVPVPSAPAILLARVLERCRVPLPFRSDSIAAVIGEQSAIAEGEDGFSPSPDFPTANDFLRWLQRFG